MTKEIILGSVKFIGNLGLPVNKAWARVVRRAVLAGLIAFAAESVVGIEPLINPLYVPLLVAFGMAIDKTLREILNSIK